MISWLKLEIHICMVESVRCCGCCMGARLMMKYVVVVVVVVVVGVVVSDETIQGSSKKDGINKEITHLWFAVAIGCDWIKRVRCTTTTIRGNILDLESKSIQQRIREHDTSMPICGWVGVHTQLTGNDFAHLHHLLRQNLVQLQQMLTLLLLSADLAGRQARRVLRNCSIICGH